MESLETYNFAGVKISIATLKVAATLIAAQKSSASNHFHLVAASTFYGVRDNKSLQAHLNSGITFCDSKPLSSWIKTRGFDFSQIRGTDLFREVLRICDSNLGHYFIGTTDENLSTLITTIRAEHNHVKISGSFAPPFSMPTQLQLSEWALKIQRTEADIVWLSLGSPKQDIVAAQLAELVSAKIVAVGAAFDFYSKAKAEAPYFIQRMHLEWLFRLIQEPKRLWKRYTFGLAYFLYLVARDLTIKINSK